jgi:hypothetical protein
MNGSANELEFFQVISMIVGMGLPVIIFLYVLSCFRRITESLEELADHLERFSGESRNRTNAEETH